MEALDDESKAILDKQLAIVEELNGMPMEASQEIYWISAEFGEVTLKKVRLPLPGQDVFLYSLQRKWQSEKPGTSNEKFTFNASGEILALERWVLPDKMPDNIHDFTEGLELKIGITPGLNDYKVLHSVVASPGEIWHGKQPGGREAYLSMVMPGNRELSPELAMDPELQKLKARWLDEASRYNQSSGTEPKKDEAEMLRLMVWRLEMQRAGIIITDMEMIEAGFDPWVDE